MGNRLDKGKAMALRPEMVFLVVALLAGLWLTFLITPLAGGNEVMNFQRAAALANGQWQVGDVRLPAGIAELLSIGDQSFAEGAKPPYTFSAADMDRLRSLALRADQQVLVPGNPIAVLNPIAYLPQVPAMALAQSLGLGPLAIFQTGRLAGLLFAILLTFLAIRILPVRRYALAAVALLPPVIFGRSTLDADQFNNALAFLFTALVVRAILAEDFVRRREAAVLALVALALASAKSAYLLLPFLVLAIPARRFATGSQRIRLALLVIVPGLVASAGWMLFLKTQAFTAVSYTTWSGLVVPDQQLALILAQPLDYLVTLLRTLFATPFLPRTLADLFGTFGPPVTMNPMSIAVVMLLFLLVIFSEQESGRKLGKPFGLLVAGLVIVTTTLILTLLYLQWTRVGSPVIEGFNARYLFPLLPLLILALPLSRQKSFGGRPGRWLLTLALASAAATLATAYTIYVP